MAAINTLCSKLDFFSRLNLFDKIFYITINNARKSTSPHQTSVKLFWKSTVLYIIELLDLVVSSCRENEISGISLWELIYSTS